MTVHRFPSRPFPEDIPSSRAVVEGFEISGRTVHPALNRICDAQGEHQVEPKVMEVLVRLAKESGRVVSREELLEDVWKGAFVSEEVLTRAVVQLRRVFEDDSSQPRVIETIRKRGYRLIAELCPLPDETGRAEVEIGKQAVAVEAGTGEGLEPARLRPPLLPLALLLMVMLAAAFGWAILGRPAGRTEAAAPTGHGPHLRKSVAVLGFRNLSEGSTEVDQHRWLSPALVEMISTELAAGGELRTVPGENVALARAELELPHVEAYGAESLGRLRERLSSDVVVLGSFLASAPGDDGEPELRIDLRAQDTLTGETVLAVGHSGPRSDLVGIAAILGSRLRQALGARSLSDEEEGGLRALLPASAEATRLYSAGLQQLRAFNALAARDYLLLAVEEEPLFPLAHLALADAWAALGYDGRAREEAKTAFELGENLPWEAKLLLEARFCKASYQWDRAETLYQALWSVAPDGIEHGLKVASIQISVGRGGDAFTTVERLRQLPSPLSEDPRIDLKEAYAAQAVTDYRLEQRAAEAAITKASARGASGVVAWAKILAGEATAYLGDTERAALLFQESRAIFQALGDQGGAAAAVLSLGTLRMNLGDPVSADRSFEDAAQIYEKIGNRGGTADTVMEMGWLLFAQGHYSEARIELEEARTLYQEVGKRREAATALNRLASVAAEQGETEAARAMYEEALAESRAVGDLNGVGSRLSNLAIILGRQGELARAKSLFEEALAISRHLGKKRFECLVLLNLGGLEMEMGNLDGGDELVARAREMASALAHRRFLAVADALAGSSLHNRGDLMGARKLLDSSLEIHESLGEDLQAARTELYLAEVALAQGLPAEAELRSREVQGLLADQRVFHQLVQAHAIRAEALALLGRNDQAAEQLERALSLAEESEAMGPRLMALCHCGTALGRLGSRIKARDILEDVANEAADRGFRLVEQTARLKLAEVERMTGSQGADEGPLRRGFFSAHPSHAASRLHPWSGMRVVMTPFLKLY